MRIPDDGGVPRTIRHDVVDSTNERAFASLAEGIALDADVHVALGQTSGRGRLGRRWESPTGDGLYLSFIHLPPSPGPPPPAITMAAGLAVLEACGELGLDGARLEWPNDVVVGDAKLAGILVESRGYDPARPHFVVGIGVNVRQRSFPTELAEERLVTSLALEGVTQDPNELLDCLVPRLAARLASTIDSQEDLARDYVDATGLEGARVSVTTGKQRVEGRLLSLDLENGVLVDSVDGPVTLDLAHVHALDRCSL